MPWQDTHVLWMLCRLGTDKAWSRANLPLAVASILFLLVASACSLRRFHKGAHFGAFAQPRHFFRASRGEACRRIHDI